jgi:hypothetical protein
MRRREGLFRDSRDASRVPLGTLNVLMGTHRTSGHVPKTPFAGFARRDRRLGKSIGGCCVR